MQSTSLSSEELYGANNYSPLPVVLSRGQGVYVWDDQGNQYLDMLSAYSAMSHGHCHPKLIKALTAQAQQLTMVSRAVHNDQLPKFLERLCQVTGFDKALPMNSGAEAVETALKAVRRWAYNIKKVPADLAEIIICDNNFHGRTIAIVGMSTNPKYRTGFGPFPPGFKHIPFGDAQALEQAITPNTCAFLVEPIQGEGGINVPPPHYLKQCYEICQRHNVLLVCDEVQTGLGRTGKLLACQHDGIKPDGLLLGKALGGGMYPVSAFLSHNELMGVFTPGSHGSTFGGNPLAAAVGIAAINVLLEEKLTENAALVGDYLLQKLQQIQSPLIKEVRGRGLLIGIEINPERVAAREVCLKLLQKGVICCETRGTTIRFAPPLMFTKAHADTVVAKLTEVLNAVAHANPQ